MMRCVVVMRSLRGSRSSPDGAKRNPGLNENASSARRDSPSDLPLDHLQLELGDGLGRIETLRARLGAVHDGMAAVEPERIFKIIEPLAGGFVARILDPARRLQQRGGPQEALAVPPIARAGGRAAGAPNAFVEAVELFAVLVALPPF